MKPFDKEMKRIVVGGQLFICLIDQRTNKEMIDFKIYPDHTKTSSYWLSFSWKVNWLANLVTPKVCAKLVQYAIESGWEYKEEHAVMRLEHADHLVEELNLADP
jgi:hypothetical protein